MWNVSGVRLDRVRGGRQKYKRSPESDTVHLHPVSSSVKKPYKDCTYSYLVAPCANVTITATLLFFNPLKFIMIFP